MACFPPNVFAVAIGVDLIVFDSRSDRYLALPGAVRASGLSDVDHDAGTPTLAPEAGSALQDEGLLAGAAGPLRWSWPAKPDRAQAAMHAGRCRPKLGDLARFGAATLASAWLLRQGRSCRHFSSARDEIGVGAASDLPAALARLRAARLVSPSPRRCLPASLAAARFLRGLGHEVEIVFGVRSHPFAAHCWIEARGVVLDDDLDRVRAYTPIAVGRL